MCLACDLNKYIFLYNSPTVGETGGLQEAAERVMPLRIPLRQGFDNVFLLECVLAKKNALGVFQSDHFLSSARDTMESFWRMQG